MDVEPSRLHPEVVSRMPWPVKTLFAITVWGASFVATKTALREVGPFTVVAVRFAIGVAVLLAVVTARGQMRALHGRELWTFAWLGFLGVAFHQFLQVTGLRYTSATNTGWIIALGPVFTVLLARVMLHERLAPVQVAGVVMAFAGALVVVGRGRADLDFLRLPSTWGDLLIFLSAPNWAFFSVQSKPVLRTRPAALVMTWVLLMGWAMTLPVFVATQGWTDLQGVSRAGWTALLFLGFFCSGFAYIFWYDSLQQADASRVSAFLYLEPLVTVAVAAWLLHEPITAPTLIGGAVILAGVWLVNQPQRAPRLEAEPAIEASSPGSAAL